MESCARDATSLKYHACVAKPPVRSIEPDVEVATYPRGAVGS